MSVPFNTEFLLPLLKPKGFSCPFLFTSQLSSSARAHQLGHTEQLVPAAALISNAHKGLMSTHRRAPSLHLLSTKI